jgi:hypothetical protein
MPTINKVSNHSEMVYSSGTTNLAASAATTNGTHVGASATTLVATYYYLTTFNIYINYRAFLSFDLSGESGTVTGVTLTVMRQNSATTPILHFLASEASDDVATTDYQDGLVGATGYPFTDDVTKFVDSGVNMNADGGGDGDQVTFTFNAAAVTHANAVMGSGKFKVAIVNQYDLNNTYGSSGIGNAFAIQGAIFNSTQDSTTGNHPILNVTTAAAAAPQRFTKLNSGNLTINSGTLIIK